MLLAITVGGLYTRAQEQAPLAIIPAATSDIAHAAKINEIYTASYLEDAPELRIALMDLLAHRVSYQLEPVSENNKYPLISSLPLMNRMNPEIVPHDPVNFTPSEFNPLIYSWNFFSDKLQVYRIDGTDYLLIVQPH